MAKLTIYDPSQPREEIEHLREQRFLQLSPQEKLEELLALIRLTIAMNGGEPIKKPQGKGLVISKKNN